MSKRLTTGEFISKCKSVHGDQYDYSKVEYVNNRTKIIVICSTHGEFHQLAKTHVAGKGCPKCSRRDSESTVINKFKNVHGDKYDYSKVEYKTSRKKVIIICPTHGEFEMGPGLHIQGRGCSACNNTYIDIDELKLKFKNVHGDKYDYSLVTQQSYISSKDNIKIICQDHGEFLQTPNNHLRGTNCPKCVCTNKDSTQEVLIRDLLNSYNINYLTSDRNVIKPQELDIFIPEFNLAIECNGHYWHSTKFRDKDYHLNKTIECKNNNVDLLHFWEHEINNKFDIVESMILSRVNISNRIYARKCEIREVDSNIAYTFLENNHLQGKNRALVNLGLYYNNKLVSLMTFNKPRFNKNYEWELIRFCNLLNHNVVGGASRLLKYFINNYMQDDTNLITYANLRYSSGNLYNKLGFTKVGMSKPSYFYFSHSSGILSRYQAQKHKLKSLLGNGFDSSLTETQNMLNNGYMKIYDCGNLIFELKKEA